MYTFGYTSAVLSDGRVHDGEWHNATVTITGQDLSCTKTSNSYVHVQSFNLCSII